MIKNIIIIFLISLVGCKTVSENVMVSNSSYDYIKRFNLTKIGWNDNLFTHYRQTLYYKNNILIHYETREIKTLIDYISIY